MTKAKSELSQVLKVLDKFVAYEDDQLDKDIENDVYVQNPIDYTRERFLEAREMIVKIFQG